MTHAVIGAGFLRREDLARILDENPWVSGIELSNYGEMFLNPGLLGILQDARARNVSLTARNGVNLNTAGDDVLEGLVRHRFRMMTCSIDGATDQTYKIYRVNGDLEAVLRNIRTINRFKRKYHSPYPILTWQFVVMGHNECEIPIARKMADDLRMRFRLKLSWDDAFSPVRNQDALRRAAGAASREEFKRERGRDYGHRICHQLWDQPQINWDGRVLGCCRNFWGEFGGNAFRMGLLPAINSERLHYARSMLLGRKESRSDVPCASCEIYLQMKAAGRWLKRGPLHSASLAKDRIARLLRHY